MEMTLRLDMSARLEAAVYALVKALEGLAGVFPTGPGGPGQRGWGEEPPVPWEVVTVQSQPPAAAPPTTGDPPPRAVTAVEALLRKRAQTAARAAKHRAKKKREQGCHPAPPEQNSPETTNCDSEHYSTGAEASTPQQPGNATSSVTSSVTGSATSVTSSVTKGGLGGCFKDSSSQASKTTPPKPPTAKPANAVTPSVTADVTRAVTPRVAPRAQAAHRAERPRGRAGARAADVSQLELAPDAQVGSTGPSATSPPSANALQDRVDAIWRAAGRGGYHWTPRDDTAVRGLLAAAGGDVEEIVRRLRNAVGYGFPKCTGMAVLLKEWNMYGAPEARAAPPAQQPPPGADVGRVPVPEEGPPLPKTEAGRLWRGMLRALHESGRVNAAQMLSEVRSVTMRGGALVTTWRDAHQASAMEELFSVLVVECLGEGAPSVKYEVAGGPP